MQDPLSRHNGGPERFAAELNAALVEEGVGWQLQNGLIVTRGSEAFEQIVSAARATLAAKARATAASHLHEALLDLTGRWPARYTTRWARWNVWPAT